MMRVQCEVTVTAGSDIAVFWVAIDSSDLTFGKQKKASRQLPVDEELYLTWYFRGESGAAYKISIAPPGGYKVASVGKHPVDHKIPKTLNASAGSLRFYIGASS